MHQAALQDAWDRIHQNKPASSGLEPEVVALAAQLPRGALVLDAGCGRGRHALHLAQASLAVHGCDLSPTAIAVARERLREAGLRARLVVADLRHLPYPDGLFAAAVCVHVLPYHCWHDMVQAGRELARVLAPGGRLYFDLLDRADAEYGCGKALEAHTFLDPDGVPTHYVSRQEIDELVGNLAPERVARVELGPPGRLRVRWTVLAMKQLCSPERRR